MEGQEKGWIGCCRGHKGIMVNGLGCNTDKVCGSDISRKPL